METIDIHYLTAFLPQRCARIKKFHFKLLNHMSLKINKCIIKLPTILENIKYGLETVDI